MAAGYGNTETMLLLLSRGANPHARNAKGATALDAALEGLPDLDRFTLFGCQDATVRAFVKAVPNHPRPTTKARLVATAKGCDAAVKLANPSPSGRR
jgi:hypothetical protein